MDLLSVLIKKQNDVPLHQISPSMIFLFFEEENHHTSVYLLDP